LGFDVDIQFKQLYHDREEVTGHLRVYWAVL
jgi:23S rRNA (cytidine2498-2'-O)-methyltransferase